MEIKFKLFNSVKLYRQIGRREPLLVLVKTDKDTDLLCRYLASKSEFWICSKWVKARIIKSNASYFLKKEFVFKRK